VTRRRIGSSRVARKTNVRICHARVCIAVVFLFFLVVFVFCMDVAVARDYNLQKFDGALVPCHEHVQYSTTDGSSWSGLNGTHSTQHKRMAIHKLSLDRIWSVSFLSRPRAVSSSSWLFISIPGSPSPVGVHSV